MKTYKQLQDELRQEAIEWQEKLSSYNYSYGELAYYENYFTKKAKALGLTKEFKENGII